MWVRGEDLAPGRRGGAVVEPALDHQQQAGDAEPADHARHQPETCRDHQRMGQRRRGQNRGEYGEGTDMPDPLDHGVGLERTGGKADEIGRHDHAGDRRRIAGEVHAHRQQGAKHGVPKLQQRDAQEQRGDGGQNLTHDAAPVYGATAAGRPADYQQGARVGKTRYSGSQLSFLQGRHAKIRCRVNTCMGHPARATMAAYPDARKSLNRRATSDGVSAGPGRGASRAGYGRG